MEGAENDVRKMEVKKWMQTAKNKEESGTC
jgi:hypothetical protein